MNNEFLQTLLNQLTPPTLARIVVDLEQAQEDWVSFPETAPTQADQQALVTTLAVIREIGQMQARAEGLDFEEMIEQIRAEQDEADWQAERGRQEVDNWLSDFD
jgi:hypothetical protein